MNTEAIIFFKRTGIVATAMVVLTAVLRLYEAAYLQVALLLAGWCGFIWACRPVAKSTKRMEDWAWTALLAVVLALGSRFFSIPIVIAVVEYRYKIDGYEMKPGYNVIAPNGPLIDLMVLSNRIDQERLASTINTNELKRLQEEFTATQRRLEFWQADIRKRGPRLTVPVPKRTNMLRQTGAAALGDSHHD